MRKSHPSTHGPSPHRRNIRRIRTVQEAVTATARLFQGGIPDRQRDRQRHRYDALWHWLNVQDCRLSKMNHDIQIQEWEMFQIMYNLLSDSSPPSTDHHRKTCQACLGIWFHTSPVRLPHILRNLLLLPRRNTGSAVHQVKYSAEYSALHFVTFFR